MPANMQLAALMTGESYMREPSAMDYVDDRGSPLVSLLLLLR
jgi:hypothetical protein